MTAMSLADLLAHEAASHVRVSPEIVRAVAQYEVAAARAVELSDEALNPDMSDLLADDLAHAEDLLAGARATLAAAGLLHLVEAEEHGKAKEPLPTRPPRPHPNKAVAS